MLGGYALMVIGLTGKSCSGKDTVASLLPPEYFTVIDEDSYGHEALVENKAAVVSAFGPEILNSEGEIDRKRLGAIVFSDPEGLKTLESINHSWMREKTAKEVERILSTGKIPVINAALLERMKLISLCTSLIYVSSRYENRLKRALLRDGVTEASFYNRTKSQEDIGETIYSQGKSVITLFNDSDKECLSRQVKYYCDKILESRGF